MNKVALITGSTDGIGKATAIALAKQGYTIHVLGRNEERGATTLNELKEIAPDRNHKLYIADLATVKTNNEFLDKYLAENKKLDILILNALAYTKEVLKTEDGIETTFAVGHVSRYIFTIRLEELLQKSEDPRVVHIGEGFRGGKVPYDQLKEPTFGRNKAVYFSYRAEGYFVYFVNEKTSITTPHEFYYPGFVSTKQSKELSSIILWVSSLVGILIEPEKAGEVLATHIKETKAEDVTGKYFTMLKNPKTMKIMSESSAAFDELIAFDKEITGLSIS
jgi:NAD(P)-dependent dehydrogenase (short-subunit alcohol dehydrogenase family)